ncbi:thioesterase domain-containing protein [Stieleria varia]|uniref:Chondramide synthase cmdD n=1 Tax=Stieleria varia TaxID=2528005 RepID=A0A5C6AZ85_9BACT|nr:thioesterase domain-containing protein [Stieleria varia]TWU04990.1 Chondramide synthase cmdD [Stieleria varia]
MNIEHRISQLSPQQRRFLASRLAQRVSGKTVEDRKQLVAWYSAAEDHPLTEDELREFAKATLPSGLCPARFVRLSALPRTASGKIDRLRLSAVIPPPKLNLTPAAGRLNETASKLREIWNEVLGTSPASVSDDFFQVGGDSLAMIRVIALCRESGWHVTPTMFHAHPTIDRLATAIDDSRQQRNPVDEAHQALPRKTPGVAASTPGATTFVNVKEAENESAVVCLSERTNRSPLFLIPPKAVEVSNFRDVAPYITDYTCFAPVMTRRDAADLLTVEDVAKRFLTYVRAIQPTGPFRLAGTCEGAYIAWEMACLLSESGEKVQFLGIIDTPNPSSMVFKPLSERLRLRLRSLSGQSIAKIPFQVVSRLVSWIKRRAKQTIVKESHLTRAGSRMGWQYSPRHFQGKAILFRACHDVGETDFTTDPAHGWDGLPTEGLNVWSLPCHRLQLLVPPFSKRLALEIQSAIASSSTVTESSLSPATETHKSIEIDQSAIHARVGDHD